jgi:hypothetical protein
MGKLTDRVLATGVTVNDLIHIVITGDTSQNPAGSSYKATVGQLLENVNFSLYIETTYDDFIKLIGLSQLQRGAWYLITDYQTIYIQPDYQDVFNKKPLDETTMIKFGEIEPLLVLATSVNTISHEVKSLNFPDDIIEYMHESEGLSLNPPFIFTKGKITRRVDRVGNDIPFDFRQVKFKRYSSLPTTFNFNDFVFWYDNGNPSAERYVFAHYDPNNPYDYESSYINNKISRNYFIPGFTNSTIWDINIVAYGGNTNPYFVDNKIGFASQNNTFTCGCDDNEFGIYLTNNIFGGFSDPNAPLEFVFQSGYIGKTKFGYYCYGNHIIDSYASEFGDDVYENYIIRVEYSSIKDTFMNNTINSLFYADILNSFKNNIINDEFINVGIGNQCENNIFQRNIGDRVGDGFKNNIFSENGVTGGVERISGGYPPGSESRDNIIDNNFVGNLIGHAFVGNKIGLDFGGNLEGQGNIISDYFQRNTIGWFYIGNVFYDGFYSNTLGNDYQQNIFGFTFYDNKIGNLFYGNIIGNNFNNNKIGNYFYDNEIGNLFTSNIIGNYFTDNTIGNNFGADGKGNTPYGNIIQNLCQYNIIGNEFYGNEIGNFFQGNVFQGRNVYLNKFGDFFEKSIIMESGGVSNFISNSFISETNGDFNFGFRNNIILGYNIEFRNMLSNFNSNIIKVGFASPSSTNVYVLDFSGSTSSSLVYTTFGSTPYFTKEIISRLDGTPKIKYIDNSDSIIITDIIN